MRKKILMVYPESPSTFWSLDQSLKIVNKKSLMPPLGLLTVAAMLPSDYVIKLVDMNVTDLSDNDILRADMVFISAMIIHRESFMDVVRRCNMLNRPVTAGGPYPTSSCESIDGVDHFILGEAEALLSEYIKDFENGTLSKIYRTEIKPDIRTSPVPRFDLIDVNDYGCIPLQFSRGCPYSCEFCDIIEMFGRRPRLKTVEQFIRELDSVYSTGFRGLVFIVDDNFIGNRSEALNLLKAVNEWQSDRGYPFTFFTEASIDLAAEDEILHLMAQCAFTMVFIGIETPDEETLASVSKQQNVKHDVFDSVKIIQEKGIEVIAGFILGFDTDREDIFDRQISFIQRAGIPMAMIGILLALPGTRLYRRLEEEGRLLHETCGNNTNTFDINFVPVMDREIIIEGYSRVLKTLYSPEKYFERSLTLISRIPGSTYKKRPLRSNDIRAFLRSFFMIGFSKYGLSYFIFLVKALIRNPRNFTLAVILSVNGYHFFRIAERTLADAKGDKKYAEYSGNGASECLEFQGENINI